MSEEFDIFDANMHPAAPFKASRDAAHRDALWHQTFHCWILRRDAAGVPHIFLQLRGMSGIFPHTLDISAAGHLQAGETACDGVREVEEELGLVIDHGKLTPLGIYKQATDDHNVKYYNREFCHTYFYETELSPADCKPQESEVDGVFEVSIENGLRIFSGELPEIEIHGIAKQAGREGYHPASRTLRPADMWGHHDRCVLGKYYLRIFILADLYFKGARQLVI